MGEPLFGLLNVNKPAGMTSRTVVDHVVRAVRPAKAGHAGTLDPMATGVLVVCVGRATRLIEHVQQQPKSYSARFLLGQRSDTDDTTGNVVEVPVEQVPSCEIIETVLQKFVGRIDQVPPQFSAVHVNGKRAYKLARKGENVLLQPRPVDVYRIQRSRYEFPELDVDIDCGSGTYVRSIGRDLGEKLGCGAVMSRLVRNAVGKFTLESAVTLDDLSAKTVRDFLLPAQFAVPAMPHYECSGNDLQQLQHGRQIAVPAAGHWPTETTRVAVIDPHGNLAAIAKPLPDGKTLAPTQVFCIAK